MTFCKELGLIISQLIWWGETQKGKSNLGKKCGAGGINLFDFRLYYQARVNKTLWYRYKNRNIEQWNKTQCCEINPTHSYRQLFFDKGGKNVQWGKARKESLFSKWCWENGQLHVKE